MKSTDNIKTLTRTVIRPDLHLAITRWSGHISLVEMVQSHKDYRSDPAYRAGMPHLFDLSEVVSPEIEHVGIEKYVSLVSRQDFGPDGLAVTLFAPTDMLYGIARQYQSIVESRSPIKVSIFRDEAEAVASIGQAGQTIKGLMEESRA